MYTSANITTPVTVLSKRAKNIDKPEEVESTLNDDINDIGLPRDPMPFKLINTEDWRMITQEPQSQVPFFRDGHAAMSVISVLGAKGTGKSTLLNHIAGKEIFQIDNNKFTTKHMTRGIDIYATHHRILLDCQPILSSSILDDFLTGRSKSQFIGNTHGIDPLTSCHMISLQLCTFLIAVSDYVIILLDWLIDIDMMKLISTSIMMIGEDDLRAKFIIYCPSDSKVLSNELKVLTDNLLGSGKVDGFFDNEQALINHITPYTNLKTELYHQEPMTFSGQKWFSSCRRIWNDNIRSSTMFTDYASLLHIYI